ncbi:MAG: DinB family protein [Acidobacteriota bacterium]|nr:DinB family protein [Acidobacteriota bacterium]MDH3531185.1 DinB family protein [Acidobacteriota bacterium]
MPAVTRPLPGEYAPYHEDYIGLVGTGEIITLLTDQIEKTKEILGAVPSEYSSFRYEDGKWTISEVVGHLIDTERVMAFRALAFARGDRYDIPGVDQDQYVAESAYRNCRIPDLVLEFEALRVSTTSFFANLESDKWMRGGNASGQFVTVRALAYIIAGHELHHIEVLRQRYLDSPEFALKD